MNDESTPMTAPPPADVCTPSPTDVLVDAWFVDTFHNRGFDAPQFNRFRAAADDLKARLRGKE